MSCFFFRTLLKWKHKKIPIGQINYNKTKIITLSSVQSLIWSLFLLWDAKKNLSFTNKCLKFFFTSHIWNKNAFFFLTCSVSFFSSKKEKRKKENKNMSNDFFPIWPEVCHTQKNKQTEIPLLKNTNSSHFYCVDKLINTFYFAHKFACTATYSHLFRKL